MKRKQTAAIDPNLLNSTPLPLAQLMQALDEVGLLFPILQAGMERGYFAATDSARPMLLDHDTCQETVIRLAIQFESRMAGCACNEDPTPEQPLPEYMTCELAFDNTGWLQRFTLLD